MKTSSSVHVYRYCFEMKHSASDLTMRSGEDADYTDRTTRLQQVVGPVDHVLEVRPRRVVARPVRASVVRVREEVVRVLDRPRNVLGPLQGRQVTLGRRVQQVQLRFQRVRVPATTVCALFLLDVGVVRYPLENNLFENSYNWLYLH